MKTAIELRETGFEIRITPRGAADALHREALEQEQTRRLRNARASQRAARHSRRAATA